jgi:hypothetical protein
MVPIKPEKEKMVLIKKSNVGILAKNSKGN